MCLKDTLTLMRRMRIFIKKARKLINLPQAKTSPNFQAKDILLIDQSSYHLIKDDCFYIPKYRLR